MWVRISFCDGNDPGSDPNVNKKRYGLRDAPVIPSSSEEWLIPQSWFGQNPK
jgi:hypothetical protein